MYATVACHFSTYVPRRLTSQDQVACIGEAHLPVMCMPVCFTVHVRVGHLLEKMQASEPQRATPGGGGAGWLGLVGSWGRHGRAESLKLVKDGAYTHTNTPHPGRFLPLILRYCTHSLTCILHSTYLPPPLYLPSSCFSCT